MTEPAARAAYDATSLGQFLRRAAQLHPTSEIVFPDEWVTFADLHRRADQFAAMLLAAGLKPGDHVGLFINPSVDYLVSLFGAERAGCCVVPISDRFRAAELRYIISHGDLVALITTAGGGWHDFVADVVGALTQLAGQPRGTIAVDAAPKLRRVFVWSGEDCDEPFEPVDLSAPYEADEIQRIESGVAPSDLAYLMYTSGTSAAPKGCMISHQAVLVQAESLAHARYRLSVEDAFWCPLPLFHNGGLATLSACLASGAKYVHTGVFEPE